MRELREPLFNTSIFVFHQIKEAQNFLIDEDFSGDIPSNCAGFADVLYIKEKDKTCGVIYYENENSLVHEVNHISIFLLNHYLQSKIDIQNAETQELFCCYSQMIFNKIKEVTKF